MRVGARGGLPCGSFVAFDLLTIVRNIVGDPGDFRYLPQSKHQSHGQNQPKCAMSRRIHVTVLQASGSDQAHLPPPAISRGLRVLTILHQTFFQSSPMMGIRNPPVDARDILARADRHPVATRQVANLLIKRCLGIAKNQYALASQSGRRRLPLLPTPLSRPLGRLRNLDCHSQEACSLQYPQPAGLPQCLGLPPEDPLPPELCPPPELEPPPPPERPPPPLEPEERLLLELLERLLAPLEALERPPPPPDSRPPTRDDDELRPADDEPRSAVRPLTLGEGRVEVDISDERPELPRAPEDGVPESRPDSPLPLSESLAVRRGLSCPSAPERLRSASSVAGVG